MKSSSLGTLAAILALSAQAHAATITFDEIAAGNNNASITTQYAGQGVVFGSDNSGIWGGIANGDPGNWAVDGTNGPQFLGNNGVINGNTYTTSIFFTTAVNGVSFDTSRTEGSSAGQTLQVVAYAGAVMLSTQTLTEGLIDSWTSVSVGDAGITELVLTGSANGFSPYAIDNLSYDITTTVPEPANVALMLAGLGAIGVLRKRRLR